MASPDDLAAPAPAQVVTIPEIAPLRLRLDIAWLRLHRRAQPAAIEREAPSVRQQPRQVDIVDQNLASAQFARAVLERRDSLRPIGALIAAAGEVCLTQPEHALVEEGARIIDLIGRVGRAVGLT